MSVGFMRIQRDRPIAGPNLEGPSPGVVLLNVFGMLEGAGVEYCVLHGYENYPDQVGSDVDCLISRNVSRRELLALLHENKARIGAEVVRCNGFYIVLAATGQSGSPCFLTLDFSHDCELEDLPFYDGAEVLRSRRRHGEFWIPAAELEFGSYLARSVAKGSLDEGRALRLSRLFGQNPAGCQLQIARFWAGGSAELIASAAGSGEWDGVRAGLSRLRDELRSWAVLRSPGRFAAKRARSWLRRAGRLLRPDGVNVVLLGPDGAGKSSLVEALGPKLAGVFPRWTCGSFAPPLFRRFRQPVRRTDQPHGLPPRSLPTSILRAGYWFAFHTLGYPKLRLALARSTLVIHDRHFVDILVDAKRYRYGGPTWLLRLIWRLIPKPDLIVLLDAPPEVLQARKQEVPFEVTARQREAYLSLVRTLPNGHIVDAAQSREDVADDVSAIVLQRLALRTARRNGLETDGTSKGRKLRLATVGTTDVAIRPGKNAERA